MRSGTILSAVYPVRIKAVEVLLAAADRRVANGAELRSLSASLDKLTPRYADAKIAMGYSAFADLLRTLAMLVEWRAAVLSVLRSKPIASCAARGNAIINGARSFPGAMR